jgi:hypothetical protein
MAAGAGAAQVWAGWILSRMGLHLDGGAVVLLVPAFAAGWGAFVAPVPSLAALAIAVVLRVRDRQLVRSNRTLEFVTLGILGIALAWTAVPLLL